MAEPRPPRAPVGFLELLDPSDRAELVGLGRFRRFQPGEALMRQGDPTDSVIVVLEGHVKVVADTPDGRSVVHAVYGPADVVGEFEAIGDHPARAANVIALDSVTSRVVSRREYLDYLLAHPAASLNLVRILIGRLGAADRRRIASTSAGAAHAVAQYVVELLDSAPPEGNAPTRRVTIPLAQHDLASLLALSRNSLVRALTRLRSRGLIASHGRTITILDDAGLRGYAEADPDAEP